MMGIHLTAAQRQTHRHKPRQLRLPTHHGPPGTPLSMQKTRLNRPVQTTHSTTTPRSAESKASLLQGSAWRRTWLAGMLLAALWLALLASMSTIE